MQAYSQDLRERLRAAKTRTGEDLVVAWRKALLSISWSDALAWFAHCGYDLA